LPIEILKMN